MLEMVALEDHIEEEVVPEVLAPPGVYTFICVEIKTNTETGAPGMFQKVRGRWGDRADFFIVTLRVSKARFFLTYCSSLPVSLPTNPMRL